jgi:hypothetical protein
LNPRAPQLNDRSRLGSPLRPNQEAECGVRGLFRRSPHRPCPSTRSSRLPA